MRDKGFLQKRLEDAGKAANLQDFGKHTWHSAYYHREFEDWREIPETDPDTGRVHIRRVYAGICYAADMGPGRWAARKAAYPVLTLLSALLYGLGACGSGAAGTVWYTILPQAAGLICYIVLLWCELLRAAAPRRLTVRQYRECSRNVLVLSLAGGVLQLLCGGTTLLFAACTGTAPAAAAVLLFAGAAGCLAAVWYLERRVSYRLEHNDQAAQDGYAV